MCHASDVARGFVAACGNETSYGEAYNVAGDEWVTWRRYYEVIAECLNAPSLTEVCIPTEALEKISPERSAQCARSFQYPGIYDNSRAREQLNYRCEISLQKGMERNLNWLMREDKIVPWEDDPEYDEILERYLKGDW